MELTKQILFLLSALGATNGFVFGLYFLIKGAKKTSNYFLGVLILVLSIRILKSAFFYFNPDLSQWFIQLGISACILIGPILYSYVAHIGKTPLQNPFNWLYHILPAAMLIIGAWLFLPYRENVVLWSKYLVRIIYLQWLCYLIASFFLLLPSVQKLLHRKKPEDIEIWALNILFGVFFIWFAHMTSPYTSYIIGALSFSFIFYLTLVLWLFRKKGKSVSMFTEPKYANKKIDFLSLEKISKNLPRLMIEKEIYKNPILKLGDVAREVQVSKHLLSQYLNDNLGKSFPKFLNEYRVKAVETMMRTNNNFSLQGIGRECGFKSNSTFYSAFKEINGVSPAKYKRRTQ